MNNGGIANPQLCSKFRGALKELQKTVAEIWSVRSSETKEELRVLTPEDESRIRVLEQRLEALNEEARLSVKSSTPILKETTFKN